MSVTPRGPRDRLVILGGGPAGLAAARRAVKGAPDAQVVLVNRSREQTNVADLPAFLATGRNVQADLAAIAQQDGFELVVDEAVEVSDHHVSFASGETLKFDALVVATGAVTSRKLGSLDTSDVHTARLMPDVQHLRSALLERLKTTAGPVRVSIVGAGLSGIEYAAALAEAHPGRVQVSLFGDTLNLPSETSLPYARQRLAELGVSLHEGALVTGMGADGVRSKGPDGELATAADLILLVAGERGAAEGLTPLEEDAQGRLATRPTLQTSRDWIFAAGDAATIPDAKTGEPVPHTIKMAEDTGRRAADNWLAWRKARSMVTFSGSTPGWIASLGTHDAVGQMGPIPVSGKLASSIKETLLRMQNNPGAVGDGWKKYLKMVAWFRLS